MFHAVRESAGRCVVYVCRVESIAYVGGKKEHREYSSSQHTIWAQVILSCEQIAWLIISIEIYRYISRQLVGSEA